METDNKHPKCFWCGETLVNGMFCVPENGNKNDTIMSKGCLKAFKSFYTMKNKLNQPLTTEQQQMYKLLKNKNKSRLLEGVTIESITKTKIEQDTE